MAKTLATRMAFGQEIIEIAKTNENFVVCNADTKTCGLEKFGKYFPEREFSFGIAEQNLVAASAGMAACGNKVFLATFAVFASMRACEQVRTFVCYPNLNVTVIGTHAGLQVGGDGATHAAIEDVSIMRSFPNMTVVQPADAVAARAVYGSPCIVIDLGTTTNIEVIDAHGTFVGGVIAPGLALGARSLSAAAARLPQVEPSAPTHVIGRNTREAMRSGVVLGEVARIDGMLDMVLAEMRATKAAGEGSVPIVITGDDAEALAALVGHSLTVDDALTLRGLAELYHINQKPRRA